MTAGEKVAGPCPITRRPYFMHIEHPVLGDVPTYGGPFDSYTVPEPDDDGNFHSEHYCHDRGDWIEGGNPEGLVLVTEREYNALLTQHDALLSDLAGMKRREESALNIATDRTEEHIRFQKQRDAVEAREKVLQQRVTELEPAAECWNALCASYRITCMGSAGLIEPMEGGYAHATFNLWTHRGADPDGVHDEQDLRGRTLLCEYIRVALDNYRALLSPGEPQS